MMKKWLEAFFLFGLLLPCIEAVFLCHIRELEYAFPSSWDCH